MIRQMSVSMFAPSTQIITVWTESMETGSVCRIAKWVSLLTLCPALVCKSAMQKRVIMVSCSARSENVFCSVIQTTSLIT